jgi:hypothetical protein
MAGMTERKRPMPEVLEPVALRARERHEKCHAKQGVSVDVEKASDEGDNYQDRTSMW